MLKKKKFICFFVYGISCLICHISRAILWFECALKINLFEEQMWTCWKWSGRLCFLVCSECVWTLREWLVISTLKILWPLVCKSYQQSVHLYLSIISTGQIDSNVLSFSGTPMIPVPMGIMAPAPTVSITLGMRGNKMESKNFIGSRYQQWFYFISSEFILWNEIHSFYCFYVNMLIEAWWLLLDVKVNYRSYDFA